MFTLEQIKENRRKWVEALRSGKYRQAKSRLRTDKGMCCLGVLAAVAGCRWRKGIEGWEASGEPKIAPKRAMEFVGLKHSGAFYDQTGLAEENDKGTPFSGIADIIESNPPGLFLTDEEIERQAS